MKLNQFCCYLASSLNDLWGSLALTIFFSAPLAITRPQPCDRGISLKRE
jgi:hypothetical protein